MKLTDTSEKGLEALIVRDLCTGGGYVQGNPAEYNRDVALDVAQLLAFLQATQPKSVEALELASEGIKRTQFLHRLQGEIAKRGVVDCLRRGVSHGLRLAEDRWHSENKLGRTHIKSLPEKDTNPLDKI